ncbi:MAG: TlpA family protein disulfide reductase, partial [Anaerolineae bacterium]
HPASRIPHPASRISHPASRISHPAPRIPHPVSRGSWFLSLAALLIMGTTWIAISRVPATSDPTTAAPQVGFLAPDFTATTLAGETVTLSQLRGTPVVLNFWATWCPPCRAELPHFQSAHAAQGDGVIILAVDEREDPQQVAGFAQRLGLTFPIPLDTDGRIGVQYRVRAFPTTYFIDANGVIRRVIRGTTTRAVLDSTLAGLITDH